MLVINKYIGIVIPFASNCSNAPASSKRPLNVINSESNVSGKITKNKTPPRILNNAGIQRAKNT